MKKLIFALCMVVMFCTSANAGLRFLGGNKLVESWKEYKKAADSRAFSGVDCGHYMGRSLWDVVTYVAKTYWGQPLL